MLRVLATAVPWSWATAHQNRPLKAKLASTHTSDQFSASLTLTLCAPCFLSTTKSTNSAARTAATKKAHNQAGAMVSTDTPVKRVEVAPKGLAGSSWHSLRARVAGCGPPPY